MIKIALATSTAVLLVPMGAFAQAVPPEILAARAAADRAISDRRYEDEERYLNNRDEYMLDKTAYINDFDQAKDFAKCVARTGEKRLVSLLDTSPGSSEEAREAKQIFARYGTCSDKRRNISMRFLRGAASEALLDKEALGSPTTTITFANFTSTTPKPVAGNEDSTLAFQQMAECRAAASPAAVRTYLAMPVEDSVKPEAMMQLQTATQQCGVLPPEEGNVLALLQRSFLAEAAVHLRDYMASAQ